MYKLGLQEAEEPEIKLPTFDSRESKEGFPGSSAGEESSCSAGDLGPIPGLGTSPGGGHGNPLHSILAWRIPMDRRSLASYSPWGCKESDMTERLSTAQKKQGNSRKMEGFKVKKKEGIPWWSRG